MKSEEFALLGISGPETTVSGAERGVSVIFRGKGVAQDASFFNKDALSLDKDAFLVKEDASSFNEDTLSKTDNGLSKGLRTDSEPQKVLYSQDLGRLWVKNPIFCLNWLISDTHPALAVLLVGECPETKLRRWC